MVCFQSLLEGVPCVVVSRCCVWLIHSRRVSTAIVVVHQIVLLLDLLLATPDTPAYNTKGAEDKSAADANHDADNGIACARRHA